MSVYNIREKFSYVIATSSIDYIRNYNFNTSTVSDIPITMTNSDDTIPITVNMTTAEPWMQIVDPLTGKDVKLPNGNIILQPGSSSVVLLKIDLPPEIESRPETVIYPNISLDIKSGSFPILLPSQVPGATNQTTASLEEIRNSIVPEQKEYVLDIGETVKINLAVYDASGSLDTTSNVSWQILRTKPEKDIETINYSVNNSIIKRTETIKVNRNWDSKTKKYITPRTVTGVWPGEVYVLLTAFTYKNSGPVNKRVKQVGKRTLVKFTVTNKQYRKNTSEEPSSTIPIPVTGSSTTSATQITGSITPLPSPPPPIAQDDDTDGVIL